MTASPEQLHSAFSYCVDFAKHMLEDSGSFLPFGAALSTSGDVKAVAGWNGEEHPAPAEIYQLLSSALRDEATNKTIAGSAVAVDVNIPAAYDPPLPDGIRVRLEGDGYSRYIYVPYVIKMSGLLRRKREVKLAEPFSVEVPAEVFAVR
ncbi:hypothetical protein HHL08_01935 [Sphingobium sp. AR-3-1]|uniref:Uncharacterized protein n=1 Tax=Sphingobium psychrophilum TaxID=2728834 RepID=A0A7X9WS85_9SPHN|nr:hypothetical protein [Sphingobium psychrophilum]NML08914.1 hypothetical protein [Sphingobium psychrophilum]